ncbi:hypothetical protein PNEG_01146 [Pneumocystis murina B123]|uniref:C2H2-type domain-containing protein n=1 Tax=Pneumocystis murina (strain B123) TaxID=1069680 RepID=M7P9A1_PNEMU|nr:hypothetical protein PNEG_01146 [Pneumocystis murina B123]EMR10430.1 hypothetical protein PNEG_01146 [Pneumocystis murina B123]
MATIQSKQSDEKDPKKQKGLETRELEESCNKRRYPCSFEGCNKAFQQQAHLRIHLRCHSGEKPFVCEHCGKTFAQLGNLKTHQRRHTGEKPYICTYPNCEKKFAQKGNLRAHKLIHEGIRPYVCRLDNCTKTFTQLGNLKVHQNKFHNESICRLNAKLMSVQLPNPEDEQLLDYFSTLYRYSNQGIKGRGKEKIELPLKQETQSINDATDASEDFSVNSPHLSSADKMVSQTIKHENSSITDDIGVHELLQLNQEQIQQLIALNKLEKIVSDDLQDNSQNTLQELEQINVRDLLLQLGDPSNLHDMTEFP